jgi:hypothetical protein|tara:strand:- start:181 stop:405 length:225 start_codon:yes stop_codon:yes gene_type:complete
MEMFLLVLSMWGKTEDEKWIYIGNQNVLNQEFTLEQCEKLADNSFWTKHHTNEYYDIQIDCMPKSSGLGEKNNG